MDERVTFAAAALSAELAASVLFYALFPASPVCAASAGLISYAGEQVSLVVAVWALILVAAWITAGNQLTRLRQNLSSKLKVLALSGFIGAAIDTAVSLYQISAARNEISANAITSPVVLGLLVHAALYAGIFAAVVLAAHLIRRTRKTAVTPPPRFGRE